MPDKTTIKIFIASAGEVKAEREKAVHELVRLNKSHQHLDLEPVVWEYDMVKGNNPGFETIQDAINPKLKECAIVVLVFYSCIRPNTRTEFDYATKEGKKIFTFFKDGFSPKNKEAHTAYGELIDFKDGLNSSILRIEYNDTDGFGDAMYKELNQYLYENYSIKTFESTSPEVSTLIRLLAEKEERIKQLVQMPGTLPDAGTKEELEKLKEEKNAIQQQLQQSEEIIKQQEKTKLELEQQLGWQKDKDELKAKALIAVEEKDYAKAEEYLKESARSSIEETAATFYELAKIKKLQFQHAVALNYYELAVKVDSENSLYLNEAGIMADDLGFFKKAIEYYEKSLMVDKKNYGDEHPNIAVVYNNLSVAYGKMGEYDKTIEYCIKALAINEKNFGKENPFVAAQYSNLGLAYGRKGECNKAIEYCTKALVISQKIHGDDHPSLAIKYNNLGIVYGRNSMHDKTIEYCTKALAIGKAHYGEESQEVGMSYKNLGIAYFYKGEFDKGIEYCTRALAIDSNYYGEEHIAIAATYNNLGLVYNSKGDRDKAIEYYLKALVIDRKYYGEEHPDIAMIYGNLGTVYLRKTEYDNAIMYLQKALMGLQKFYTPEHPNMQTIIKDLAAAQAAFDEKNKKGKKK